MNNNKTTYNHVLILESIYCRSCENLITVDGICLAITQNEITLRAEHEHKTRVVCDKPQLLITTKTALLSDELFKELEKTNG